METFKRHPVFPEGLTEKDKELINQQCQNQHATKPEQIEGFARAYAKAKAYAEKQEWPIFGEKAEALILEFAEMIEPRNKDGYRTTPVTFANMNRAVSPDVVPRAMTMFAEAYAEAELAPAHLYEEFQKIHPFEDGNGRVGDLLWKIAMARENGEWPETLPPDLFGAKT